MEYCDYCGSIALGGECANLNCEHARKLRNQKKTKKKESSATTLNSSRPPRKTSAKGNYRKFVQSDGKIALPPEIHLKREESLPAFMGYKTNKKALKEERRAALKVLFDSEFSISQNASNFQAISGFGPPSSEIRKKKLLSWFDGRIDKSAYSHKLQESRMKLIVDRAYVSDNF
jgi:hypothetical protein